jgi:hypothetical protein
MTQVPEAVSSHISTAIGTRPRRRGSDHRQHAVVRGSLASPLPQAETFDRQGLSHAIACVLGDPTGASRDFRRRRDGAVAVC